MYPVTKKTTSGTNHSPMLFVRRCCWNYFSAFINSEILDTLAIPAGKISNFPTDQLLIIEKVAFERKNVVYLLSVLCGNCIGNR